MTTKLIVNKRSVSTLFLGGLIGAGTAMLFAPSSGRETRRKIGHYADEVKFKAGDYLQEGKDLLSSAYGKGAKYIDGGRDLISASIEAGKKAYKREKERLTH